MGLLLLIIVILLLVGWIFSFFMLLDCMRRPPDFNFRLTKSGEYDKILWALRTQGNMTDTEIYSDLFGRHQKSERIAQALGLLLEASLVEFERVETAGRPSTLWRPNAAGLNAPSALNAHTSGGEGES